MEPTPEQAHKGGYGTNTTAAKNGVYSLLLANKNVFTRLSCNA
ncbi:MULTISPECIES: hypothetical protein [Nostoc]|nr:MULTISPECIES: hypothetical protein [Nostoc]